MEAPAWVDNAGPRSHMLVNENPTAKGEIFPYES